MLETQYYKKIKNKRIAIFGIMPPPLGGVSIHIQRVAKKFQENNNSVYHFKTEFRGRRWLLPFYLLYATLFLLWNKIDTLYYHSLSQPNSITEIRFLIFIKKILKFQIILVEHNCKHMYKRSSRSKSKLSKSMKYVDEIIFLWNSTHKSYIDNAIKIPQKYSIDSAFLPPDKKQKTHILNTYPKLLQIFLETHNPILLVNASRMAMYNNQDLYGLDKSIHAISKLKKNHHNIGLIVALAKIDNRSYFIELNKKIENLGITENIFFLIDQHELWPLMENIDIFLRPTLYDGTGISIFEAFIFNKVVIASNVCERPQKTILFDIKDQDDFVNKINLAIHKGSREVYRSNKKNI